jgi:hypothetical protein
MGPEPRAADGLRVDPELLAKVLREWAAVDLVEYADAGIFRQKHMQLRKDLAAIVALSCELSSAIQKVKGDYGEDTLLWWLQNPAPIRQDQTTTATRMQLASATSTISSLASNGAAYLARLRAKPGQPRNLIADRVLLDLAAIYRWATDREPTRITGRDDGADDGPFYEFAAAVWPLVFADADAGLSAALKRWGANRSFDASALIANIRLRHPEWWLLRRTEK